MLETAAHTDPAGLPLDRYLVEIVVPKELWEQRREVRIDELPPTWNAIPAGSSSVRVGSSWLKSRSTLIMTVPSAIVEEERVALINPAHPDASKLVAKALRKFLYEPLFRKQTPRAPRRAGR